MLQQKKKEELTGEKGIVDDRTERIQAYLERLENIFLNENLDVRERNIELLKPLIYKNILIKQENFPESYFDFQKKLSKERGLGDVSFGENEKSEEIQKVIESQKMSLDAWIDYLTGNDAKYPTDIKYFVIQGILKLGNFDTVKYSFTQRERSTTASFPEIDRQALSAVMGVLEAKHHNKPTTNYSPELIDLVGRNRSFGDMYALVMRQLDEKMDKSEVLPIIEGEWKVFEKGSDPQELVESLVGKRSNICIADIGSATRYLSEGSVEIYFSNNLSQKPTIPRIAIAIKEDIGVYEVRGTYNKNEDIDPYIEESSILSDRLKSIKNGESFANKDKCMKEMTKLYNKCFVVDRKTGEKTYLNPILTKDDLQFLYEVDSNIEGFGYKKDPRIEEIKSKRNLQEDLPIIFECEPSQIALKKEDIKIDTITYIGEWTPEVMNLLPESTRYIYEKFPDKKAFIKTIETDPNINSPETAKQAILDKGFKLYGYAEDFLQKISFSKEKKEYNLVSFSVKGLGFSSGATTKQIYDKAEELGLELCPAEVGPLLRLNYLDQPNGEYLRIAMKTIEASDGDAHLFAVFHGDGERYLRADWDDPDGRWDAGNCFVFLRRSK